MPDVRNASVKVAFTSEEKRKLVESARIEGRSLAEYIRERVLAECRVEDEVFHLLLNDLARAVMPLQRSGISQPDAEDASSPPELPEQQRARIVKEVRASLAGEQIEALSRFLNPAFEQGLWPGSMPRDESMGDEQPGSE